MTTIEMTEDAAVLVDTRSVRLEDLLEDKAIDLAQDRVLDDRAVSAASFNSGI